MLDFWFWFSQPSRFKKHPGYGAPSPAFLARHTV